ncbi:MAG: type II toxin-antitoxin system RelE/ParE family toxin [Oscillospiraceae bacterium]|nr:type II toxin-antitoxin system RelE/ParE family toxin [Oscillospiraceae bacterium]
MEFKFSKQAVKSISRMDSTTKNRLKQGITAIPNGDIKPLKGTADSFRLRIGDWRIIFSYPDENTVLIEKIAPRGGAYKGA